MDSNESNRDEEQMSQNTNSNGASVRSLSWSLGVRSLLTSLLTRLPRVGLFCIQIKDLNFWHLLVATDILRASSLLQLTSCTPSLFYCCHWRHALQASFLLSLTSCTPSLVLAATDVMHSKRRPCCNWRHALQASIGHCAGQTPSAHRSRGAVHLLSRHTNLLSDDIGILQISSKHSEQIILLRTIDESPERQQPSPIWLLFGSGGFASSYRPGVLWKHPAELWRQRTAEKDCATGQFISDILLRKCRCRLANECFISMATHTWSHVRTHLLRMRIQSAWKEKRPLGNDSLDKLVYNVI